jgi:hypothetical protein
MDHWTADRIADQSGRTFIVTGGNSGLGFEAARQLTAHGGRVVLAARSEPSSSGHSTSPTWTRCGTSPRRSRETGSRWTCSSTTPG